MQWGKAEVKTRFTPKKKTFKSSGMQCDPTTTTDTLPVTLANPSEATPEDVYTDSKDFREVDEMIERMKRAEQMLQSLTLKTAVEVELGVCTEEEEKTSF
uniref:Uncharacterized protein n=1 Tax=Chromera velia CCMP2878 TaxID=1169474 RepID=A0A0G4HG56_9ALVE|eukprot:Cvel_27242.t1-p1 / transcript=Cvel_27242.t1 / gene=Cvel_27242 / organism=Chromera_velia_CCMP2878 / gene_product=hypothetical protein / transcript_product=hypothetical protein / location=Cvel_scaffold3373:12758-13967(+) / protein_length=99 / sequence_SO=supercontig / SO=protein_coding / is_pseudo=false